MCYLVIWLRNRILFKKYTQWWSEEKRPIDQDGRLQEMVERKENKEDKTALLHHTVFYEFQLELFFHLKTLV